MFGFVSGNKYISQNPFRVISVLSNSGAKEIKKNLSKIKAFTKIGKSPSFKYDFSFLNLAEINRSEDVVSRIENKLLLDESKIKNSLFWFVNISPIDSVALNNLSEGNIDKAIDIWKKSIKGKEISEKNFSAFNNLSSLLFLKSLDSSKSDQFFKGETATLELRSAISKKYSLLDSKYFYSYCESILKNTNQIDLIEIKSFVSNLLVELLSTNYSNKELSDLFKGLDGDLSKNLSENLIDEPLSKILTLIKQSNEEVENDHKQGIEIGKKLIKDSFQHIKQIKEIVGKDDYQYQTVADKLSNQIMQCGILCFNKTKNDSDYLSSYKYALTIAVELKTKKRANDCIKHCKEEQQANLCSICSKNNISESSVFTKTIYKETNRTWFPRQVQYSYLDLKLKFCNSCYKDLQSKKNNGDVIKIAGLAIGLVIGLIVGELGGAIIFGGLGLGVGFLIGSVGYGYSSYIDNHPLMKEARRTGWSTSKPTA
tara:strand:+ start:5311 stop:6762 length:1452 start_codon:yes stop_codon:yes gene_type:complete